MSNERYKFIFKISHRSKLTDGWEIGYWDKDRNWHYHYTTPFQEPAFIYVDYLNMPCDEDYSEIELEKCDHNELSAVVDFDFDYKKELQPKIGFSHDQSREFLINYILKKDFEKDIPTNFCEPRCREISYYTHAKKGGAYFICSRCSRLWLAMGQITEETGIEQKKEEKSDEKEHM